jgi:hypothetical protein
MLARDDALGDLLRGLVNWETDAQLLDELATEFGNLQRKLPEELQSGDDAIDLQDSQTMRQAVEDVKHLLLSRLLSMEDGQ